MAVYQKRNNELVEVPCDCGGGGSGGSGGNIVISDAIDSTSSFTAASSKAVKTAYDHAGDLVQSQLDNQESQLNVGIVNKINNCIQDKIDSGEIGNGSGDVPATVLNRINNNETRSLTNASNISSLKSDVSSLKTSIGNASGFNTRITELETKQITDRSDIDNLQSTLQDYNALKTQVEANKNKLDQISSGSGGSGGSTGSLADIESKITKLRQDVDQNTANLGSTSSQAEQNKDDIEALEQLIGDLPSVTDVHNLSNRISKNASDLEVLQGAINDLSGGSFSEMTTALEEINGKLETTSSDIEDIRNAVNSVSTTATDTKAALEGFESEIAENFSDLDNQLLEINNKITTNKDNINELSTEVETNKSNLTGLSEKVGLIENSVAHNEQSITTNTTNISTLSNSLAEIATAVEQVEDDISQTQVSIQLLQDEDRKLSNSISSLDYRFTNHVAECGSGSTLGSKTGQIDTSYLSNGGNYSKTEGESAGEGEDGEGEKENVTYVNPFCNEGVYVNASGKTRLSVMPDKSYTAVTEAFESWNDGINACLNILKNSIVTMGSDNSDWLFEKVRELQVKAELFWGSDIQGVLGLADSQTLNILGGIDVDGTLTLSDDVVTENTVRFAKNSLLVIDGSSINQEDVTPALSGNETAQLTVEEGAKLFIANPTVSKFVITGNFATSNIDPNGWAANIYVFDKEVMAGDNVDYIPQRATGSLDEDGNFVVTLEEDTSITHHSRVKVREIYTTNTGQYMSKKIIYLTATEDTSLSVTGKVVWTDNLYSTWGAAGSVLIISCLFTPEVAILSTLYNSVSGESSGGQELP